MKTNEKNTQRTDLWTVLVVDTTDPAIDALLNYLVAVADQRRVFHVVGEVVDTWDETTQVHTIHNVAETFREVALEFAAHVAEREFRDRQSEQARGK